jgi:hypothetical protein
MPLHETMSASGSIGIAAAQFASALRAASASAPTGNRHRPQETLRHLNAAMSIIGGWVWQTDADNRFVYMSPAVERLAGRKPELHYGKTLADLGVVAANSTERSDWLEKICARVNFGPVDLVRYDHGRPFYMRTLAEPQFDAEGAFIGYIGVAFSISADHVAEPAERRSYTRRNVVRAAEIVIEDGATTYGCVLLDISMRGARLHVSQGLRLSPKLTLCVPALSMRAKCSIRWRADDQVGVEFPVDADNPRA